MDDNYLQGGCSCGRNQYEIAIPSTTETRTAAQVIFGASSEIRRAHASSLPTFLRVPLPWLQSTTYAYTKDERPSDIKRIFSPVSAPQTKRNFCGYCGTPLTFWTEERPEEAEFICVNLASLERSSLNVLDTLGVLPVANDENEEPENADQDSLSLEPRSSGLSNEHRLIRGEPWFEELIQTGPLGKVKRQRGGQVGRDGRGFVEWEIIEIEGDEGTETPLKRQMTSTDQKGDEPMDG